MLKTFKIQIKGRVQGVGFRPFVFNLAKEYQVKGTVSNNENGVVVYCTVSNEKAEAFFSAILNRKPEIAIITSHLIAENTFIDYEDFTIIPSQAETQVNVPLTPDFAVCTSCKTEIMDSKNRRFNYPFTTCVHCGPRYAITTKFPFERAHTSLTDFKICVDCGKEYTNPNDRRFHSQTNSCKSCGIQLLLTDNEGRILTNDQDDCISQAVQFLNQGEILAVKNTNGYVLCCDATNPLSVEILRKRKKRPNKPFAVLYPSIELVKSEFILSSYEENALRSRIAPIIIIQNTENTSISTDAIAPNSNHTGVMLASSTLLELIMTKIGKPIIATSGNSHGSPIISEKKEAKNQLKNITDYFLHHNLEIQFPQDDSVVRFSNKKQLILRRSRGMAPNYINARVNVPESILAMGSHLKSTFTFVPNSQTYVSQYFGNLDNYGVLERYKSTINQYVNLFETKPKIILIDKHPLYQSSNLGSELAFQWHTELHEIQHHKAHFASVLGEHELFTSDEKVLGIVWDGTGLGDDQMIWGGEFFIFHNHEIERLTHFEYYDWLANEKMAKEPRLALFSLSKHKDLIAHKFSEIEWGVYSKLLKNNKLKTSSVGRLFDAAASVLELIDVNTFEAEAAMKLENCASTYTEDDCIDFLLDRTYEKIPSKYLIDVLLKSYKNGLSKERLALSFIYTLAKCIIKIAKQNQVKTIACSGGVFQNSVLVALLSEMTVKDKINLKLNRKLSSNDENISFGQLMYHQNVKN